MNENIFKITMYKLGTFRILSVFKGKGHVNVPLIEIGTQDPSPFNGNQKWRLWWNRNESHVQPLKRLPKLTLLKDKVYTISKKGENNVNCFLLYYYLNGYYHITIEKCIYLTNINVGSEIFDASREAYIVLMTKVECISDIED